MKTDVHWHLIVPVISLVPPFSVLIQECITQPYVAKAHRMKNILAVVTSITDMLSKTISFPCFFKKRYSIMQEKMELIDGNVSYALSKLKEFIFILKIWDSNLDSVQDSFL